MSLDSTNATKADIVERLARFDNPLLVDARLEIERLRERIRCCLSIMAEYDAFGYPDGFSDDLREALNK